MDKYKTFKQLTEETRETDAYWFEKTKLELSVLLNDKMKEKEMSVKDLAKKINRSEKYINNIFAAEVNIKLEDFIKICRALNIQFQIMGN